MRKFTAIILAVILVIPFLLAAQALVSISIFMMDRQFYIDTLDNDQVYKTLVSGTLIPDFLKNGLALPEGIDASQLGSVFESVLDRNYLKSQVASVVDDVFDYLQGKQEDFSPVVDLTPLKTALTGDKQDEFLLALAQALPDCEPGQIPGIGGSEFTACKPQGVTPEMLANDYLKPILPSALAQIPNQILLVENWEEMQSYRNYRSFIPGMAVPASLLLSGIVFILIASGLWYLDALIADDAWRTRLQWLGWTLMIPSFLIFLIGLTAASTIPVYWVNFGLDRANLSAMPFFGPGLQEALRTIIRAAIPRVSESFLMVGGISGALALGLIFWGLMTSKPTSK
jgi:hypothetical protein